MRIFERYLSDIGRETLLSQEEEVELARRARAGDEAARRRLVSANLRFVVSVARHYRGRGVAFADLVNEGNVGLVRAADRFDPERGVRFISYAHFWVRRAMTRAIARELERSSTSEPPPKRISLDEPLAAGGWPLAEVLSDGAPGSDARVERRGLRDALEACFADLPERERLVLRGYFGFGAAGERDLGAIARELGVSRERVRQLKERGLSRLRAAVGRHGLDAYFEPSGRALDRPVPRGSRPAPSRPRIAGKSLPKA